MRDVPILTLGEAQFTSPLKFDRGNAHDMPNFIRENMRILNRIDTSPDSLDDDVTFEKAGPREKIYFDPLKTTAAIVTCGGLCPGLNNVIRSVVLELHHNYGVRNILGIPYGYQGMGPGALKAPVMLTPDLVDSIDRQGGTILGSSRGNPPAEVLVDFLAAHKVDILFTVGGDGTQRGALAISTEARKRGMKLAVVGIPKTVDNDIKYVDRTFGFTTAIDRAKDVLNAAHMEARSYPNGIVLVRLMGRDSGFLAAGATLGCQEVNFILIPEEPFRLDGDKGFLAALKNRILARHHALIVVAEGAGQDLMGTTREKDASGNILHKDIGPFLKEKIASYFQEQNIPISLKYIDPSYYVRSVPANVEDAILCDMYARNAVHAAMSGRTELVIGLRRKCVHVPIELAVSSRQRIPLTGDLWSSVLSSTGQAARFY
jgi:6-phosphofructokinase 1